MKRLVLLLGIAACGGGGRTKAEPTAKVPLDGSTSTVLASTTSIVTRRPADTRADTLYAEYITTKAGRKTHDVPAMLGQTRCYGGPALEGNVPAEVYVRRAINRSAVVEDVVRIFPDDLVPRRITLTMVRGPGVSDLSANGEVHGRALIEDSAGMRSVQVVETAGGLEIIANHADDDSLRLVSLGLDPAQVAESGLELVDLDTPEAWNALQADVLDLAQQGTVLSIKGELPAIDDEECVEIFSHFPPVRAGRSDRP